MSHLLSQICFIWNIDIWQLTIEGNLFTSFIVGLCHLVEEVCTAHCYKIVYYKKQHSVSFKIFFKLPVRHIGIHIDLSENLFATACLHRLLQACTHMSYSKHSYRSYISAQILLKIGWLTVFFSLMKKKQRSLFVSPDRFVPKVMDTVGPPLPHLLNLLSETVGGNFLSSVPFRWSC